MLLNVRGPAITGLQFENVKSAVMAIRPSTGCQRIMGFIKGFWGSRRQRGGCLWPQACDQRWKREGEG